VDASYTITKIDGQSNRVLDTIQIKGHPFGENKNVQQTAIASDLSNDRAYVQDSDANKVYVLSKKNCGVLNENVSSISLGGISSSSRGSIAVNAKTGLVYVSNSDINSPISVINMSKFNTVISNSQIPFSRQSIAVNPNTNTIHVVDSFGRLATVNGTNYKIKT